VILDSGPFAGEPPPVEGRGALRPLSETAATVLGVRPGLLVLVTLVLAIVGGGSASARPLSFGARSAVAWQVSSNWSGYALVSPADAPMSFTDVTGTWVTPKARCTDGRRDASAFWVGLGGYSESSTSLQQLGTAAECSGGVGAKPVYYAWWEVVPASSVRIPLAISAGDTITAAVLVSGQNITFSLKDVTRRTRFSKLIAPSQTLDVGSAEWIAEAPSDCSFGRCRTVPLTNFGTVMFTKAAAIGNAHPGTISDAAWAASPIELVSKGADGGPFFGTDTFGSGVGAVPGDVSADGRSFSVSWQRNVASG
jgi:Peptidase A4 family